MGGVVCCESRKEQKPDFQEVQLLTGDNFILHRFTHITVANTPKKRKEGYKNRVPSSNECLLLPSTELPARLRTVYSQRSCTSITLLFCKTVGFLNDRQDQLWYEVTEQRNVSPGETYTRFTPKTSGDLIIQCALLQSLPRLVCILLTTPTDKANN